MIGARVALGILGLTLAAAAGQQEQRFDVLIRGGMVLDGSGNPAIVADLGILGDTIEAIGDLDYWRIFTSDERSPRHGRHQRPSAERNRGGACGAERAAR